MEVPNVPSGTALSNAGALTPAWLAFLQKLPAIIKGLNTLETSLGNTDTGLSTKAAKVQPSDGEAGTIQAADDGDYSFIWPHNDVTAIETTTLCASGTCTATFKKAGVAFGGTANAVSTSPQTQTHPGILTLNKGDLITVTVSSGSSCEGLSFLISGTRTLA